MKKIRHIIAAAALILCPAGAWAQNYLGGVVVNSFDLGPLDMLSLSQYNTPFTTARATAMGGAFTSLGADLSSMSINPAGIGMYRGTAYGITPAMNFSGTNNSYSNNVNDSRFSFNNIGIAGSVYNSSGTLTSVNIGFSYNKLADFNYSYAANMPAGANSLADIMYMQLNGLYEYMATGSWNEAGITQRRLKESARPFENDGIRIAEWGAVLAYNTGLATSMNPGDEMNDLYGAGGIDRYASVVPGMEVVNRGSVGEYNFTMGFNLRNRLYLGFGMTVQDIYLTRRIYYNERYDNNNGDGSGNTYLRNMNYDQNVRMSGAGFNFKIGAVYRPVPSLRIGLAVHTPTWTSVTHQYSASMQTSFIMGGSNSMHSYINYWDLSYNSPTRLLAGVSYTIGSYAAVAVDYERVWYNGMRLTSEDFFTQEGYRNEIRDLFKPTDNFKAGIEIKPTPEIAVRAGYSFYGSPLRYGDDRYTKPVNTQTQNLSAGLGFRLNPNISLDFAYVYSMNRFSNFDIFYFEGETRRYDGEIVNTGGNPITTSESPISDLKLNRHTAMMTLGFNF